jgi:hypothetical protein
LMLVKRVRVAVVMVAGEEEGGRGGMGHWEKRSCQVVARSSSMTKPERMWGGGGVASKSVIVRRVPAWSEPRERSKEKCGSLNRKRKEVAEFWRTRSSVKG